MDDLGGSGVGAIDIGAPPLQTPYRSNQMKVLLLTPDAYGANGGIALYNRDVIEALVAISEVDEVVVVARHMPSITEGVPAKARLIDESAKGKVHFVISALHAASEVYSLVICCHINLLPLAVLLNKRICAPLALIVYGIDVWQTPYLLARQWLKAVDAVWSISAITTERMNQWACLPDVLYTQLPNAIHLDRYALAPRRADLQVRHGLEGARVIMTLARLAGKERYKGIDEVMEAMPTLLLDIPNLKYLVAGDGDDRQRLMQKAKELGVANRVVFTGMINEADKADYFRLADAFVMPGSGEGFGFVFLEALACGLPVVGSLLDGSREALRGGEFGELADPTDPASVLVCIHRALSKPIGIPPSLTYFDWSQFQHRLVNAFHSVIACEARQSSTK
jgi:phosphatidyl-myo-inositol dimannoside synthase